MDHPDARTAAIAVWQAFATRDADRIRAVLTDDVEWLAPAGNATAVALGVPSHVIGPDAIIRFILHDFRRLYPDGMAITPVSLTAEGSRVVFEQRQQARLANGRDVDLTYVFVFELDGARARRIREYMDTAAGLAQLFGDEAPRRIV